MQWKYNISEWLPMYYRLEFPMLSVIIWHSNFPCWTRKDLIMRLPLLSNFRFSVLIPSQLWDQTEITNDLISTLLLIFQGDASVLMVIKTIKIRKFLSVFCIYTHFFVTSTLLILLSIQSFDVLVWRHFASHAMFLNLFRTFWKGSK